VCRRHAATALAAPVWQTGYAIVVRFNQNEAAKHARAMAIDGGAIDGVAALQLGRPATLR
jgi:hypothetical protein